MSERRSITLAVLSVLALAGLVVGALALTTPHHATPHPRSMLGTTTACVHVLDIASALSWSEPQLSASALERWATPQLASSIAAAHHLTPGEVAGHTTITATAQLIAPPARDGGEEVEEDAVTISGAGIAPHRSNWLCKVATTPAGPRVVQITPTGGV